jgi:hypothetical protein
MFPIVVGLKEGDALKPLLLIFALKYATGKVQPNFDGFKLKGTNQLSVYAEHVDLLDGSVYAV